MKYLHGSFSVGAGGSERYRSNYDAIDWGRKALDTSGLGTEVKVGPAHTARTPSVGPFEEIKNWICPDCLARGHIYRCLTSHRSACAVCHGYESADRLPGLRR